MSERNWDETSRHVGAPANIFGLRVAAGLAVVGDVARSGRSRCPVGRGIRHIVAAFTLVNLYASLAL